MQDSAHNSPVAIRLFQGDARNLRFIPDTSVHLVVTSPPYWNLKRYNEHPNQMGHIADYEQFIRELTKVWAEVYRVLVPGGRLVCVVGDVCVSRKNFGRHVVFPLHADICVACRRLGFDNLNPIIWHKIANASYEVENGGAGFLGKPYEPNSVIKNDIEFILMQRKPGGYRKPTEEQRNQSRFSKVDYQECFQQFWRLTGASTREHPAPFPLELASRLVRMFSFTGDTVLDPFCGTGTTLLAAANTGRNAIGVEVDAEYSRMTQLRLRANVGSLFQHVQLDFPAPNSVHPVAVEEDGNLISIIAPTRNRATKYRIASGSKTKTSKKLKLPFNSSQSTQRSPNATIKRKVV